MMDTDALEIATLYRHRWQIELFFRWIKQNLRIRRFYGTSINAVQTQIWIAVCVYLIIAIIHREINLTYPLHRTLQILSVTPFEKVSVDELLTQTPDNVEDTHLSNQLLFNNF
jgi:IS4 transposase